MVGREGMGVTDRDITPFSLLSLDSGYLISKQYSVSFRADFWIQASKTLWYEGRLEL